MIYVASDLHGHYDKYLAMLEAISFKPTDTLYILGDVIDRGPDGCKILLDMMSRPNVIPILGNHELIAAVCLPWLLKEVTDQSLAALSEDQIATLSEWITNGGGPTLRILKQLRQEEREKILEYIRDMELYAEVTAGGRSFVLVHAGLEHFSPEKPLEDHNLQDFLFARPSPHQVYYENWYLIYGHTPTPLLHQQMREPPANDIIRRGMQIAIELRLRLRRAAGMPVSGYSGGILRVKRMLVQWIIPRLPSRNPHKAAGDTMNDRWGPRSFADR